MARVKRSISLGSDLAAQIEAAAAEAGTSVSAWLAESAARRLRLDAARLALAEYQAAHGPLRDDDIARQIAEDKENAIRVRQGHVVTSAS